MTVQAADPAVLAAFQSAPATKKDDAAGGADRFLKLLVTQLTNQDPLNPMDNAAVTSQMAQINTVEGINRLNATMSTLAMGFNASQSLQAATMVGRQVLADGNALTLAGGIAQGGYQIDSDAANLTLTVQSASGEVVYRGDLGPQAAGIHLFNWDGVASNGKNAVPGTYGFSVTAGTGTRSVAAQPLMVGNVDGVTPAADGAKLTLRGLGDVSIASVKHIL